MLENVLKESALWRTITHLIITFKLVMIFNKFQKCIKKGHQFNKYYCIMLFNYTFDI